MLGIVEVSEPIPQVASPSADPPQIKPTNGTQKKKKVPAPVVVPEEVFKAKVSAKKPVTVKKPSTPAAKDTRQALATAEKRKVSSRKTKSPAKMPSAAAPVKEQQVLRRSKRQKFH